MVEKPTPRLVVQTALGCLQRLSWLYLCTSQCFCVARLTQSKIPRVLYDQTPFQYSVYQHITPIPLVFYSFFLPFYINRKRSLIVNIPSSIMVPPRTVFPFFKPGTVTPE